MPKRALALPAAQARIRTKTPGVTITLSGMYQARIRIQGFRYDLGSYVSIEEAESVYKHAKETGMPLTGYEKRYTNPVRTERGTGTPPTPRPRHRSCVRPYVCGMCLSAHMQPCVAYRMCHRQAGACEEALAAGASDDRFGFLAANVPDVATQPTRAAQRVSIARIFRDADSSIRVCASGTPGRVSGRACAGRQRDA